MLKFNRTSAAIVIGLAIAALVLPHKSPAHVTFYLRHAPEYAVRTPLDRAKLIDQLGRSFTLTQLRGEPTVVTFVAAHCTDTCPLVNAQFAAAAHMLRREHLRVRLLTITLDPENDPPAVMRDLAQRFGADPRIWLVAGGSIPNVHAVMHSFGVVAQRGRKGYADVHTTFIYFLNARGALQKVDLASTNISRQVLDAVKSHWLATSG